MRCTILAFYNDEFEYSEISLIASIKSLLLVSYVIVVSIGMTADAVLKGEIHSKIESILKERVHFFPTEQ